MSGDHPVVLERFTVDHGEEVHDVVVAACQRNFSRGLDAWAPGLPPLNDPLPADGKRRTGALTELRGIVVGHGGCGNEQARQQYP